MSEQGAASRPACVQGKLRLHVLNNEMEIGLAMPGEPSPSEAMLPTLRVVSEAFVNMGVAYSETQGQCVTCSKGCGACCRQLVPLPPTEIRQLVRFVRSLPPERQRVIRERVEAGIRQMEAAGVLEQLENFESADFDAIQQLAFDYFRASVPCPFLEDEACGIYADRPLVCREYLVTTDPKFCRTPWTGEARGVTVPFRMNRMLLRLDPAHAWRPMLLVLRDALVNDEDPTPGELDTGGHWLQRVAEALMATKGQPVPDMGINDAGMGGSK